MLLINQALFILGLLLTSKYSVFSSCLTYVPIPNLIDLFLIHRLQKYAGGGYIIVDPELTIFKDNQRLSLNSIAMITYLPKCLGRFEEWKDRLQVAKEAGYNFIHFTPVQVVMYLVFLIS